MTPHALFAALLPLALAAKPHTVLPPGSGTTQTIHSMCAAGWPR
jgi:hypothetical protein